MPRSARSRPSVMQAVLPSAVLLCLVLASPVLRGDEPSQTRPGTDAALQTELDGKLLVSKGWKASWSPDGKQVVYGRLRGMGLRRIDLANGETTAISSSGKDATWSPDGRWIAFVKEPLFQNYRNEEVWLVKPNGESARKLADGGFPSWSSDGRRVFYHSRKLNSVMVIGVADPNAQPEEFYAQPLSFYPAVSPDEKKIAFGVRGALVIVDRQTGERELTWPVIGNRGVLGSWSPDGKKIAFGGFDGDPSGVWVLDVAAKRAVQVAKGAYTMPAWSADGTKLAFDLRLGTSDWEVWMVPTNGLAKLTPLTSEQLIARSRGNRAEATAATPVRPAQANQPQIGQEAPEIEGEDIDGVTFRLSDYRGQVVVLDFWGDW